MNIMRARSKFNLDNKKTARNTCPVALTSGVLLFGSNSQNGQQRNQPAVPFGTTPLQLESLATHHRFNDTRAHNPQEFRHWFHMNPLFILPSNELFIHWVFAHVMHSHSHNSGLDSWTRALHTHDIAQFAARCCDPIAQTLYPYVLNLKIWA